MFKGYENYRRENNEDCDLTLEGRRNLQSPMTISADILMEQVVRIRRDEK